MPWVEILAYLTPKPVVDTPARQQRPSWVTPTLLAAIEAKRNEKPANEHVLGADCGGRRAYRTFQIRLGSGNRIPQ